LLDKLKMKKGFSLIELLVVVAIFSALFAAILTVQSTSDNAWRIGRNKLIEQQDARRALDDIARLLKQSNANWVISGTSYNLAISEQNTRIDFYNPLFDNQGGVSGLYKVTYKLDPGNSRQLIKKIGNANSVVVANEVENIYFGAGCAGCASYNCTVVSSDCPIIKVQVTSKKQADFTLDSQINLRNKNSSLSSDVEVEEPAQGEF